MTGVYEYALGDEADDLHPKVRDRYGLGPEDAYATVGRGVMDITRGTLALPVLYAMPLRNLLFPESGTEIPFSVTTAGFRDPAGYEALTTRREFDFDGRVRRFDSLTVWDAERERLFDFLGTGGHVVSELHPRVEDGALVVEGGKQWTRVGGRYLPTPGPLAVDVTVRDRYDEGDECFYVTATVESGLAGHVLGYRGSFTQEQREMEVVPDDLKPTTGIDPLPP
ncbi:DUF4166 domain-containing protein [Halosimplex aquaticum]|uniref:DUF4166 domain-containing protein n=1 Tax=Halosimplex aquaticum TaxID=3026162 RepID=A0ABD5Y430_9EURY|nr:DUF4166 domain-containing protein [Halosimplex aquaticum]